MFIKGFQNLIGLLIIPTLFGCGPSFQVFRDNPQSIQKILEGTQQNSVNPKTYLSGLEFCEKYSDITSLEYAHHIEVPLNYENPNKGSLKIYAYTLAPFDKNKPTYIFVDGGPGQNSHGIMPEVLGGQFNEIRFDQRGLGCSAPQDYVTYKNQSIYSSLNTAKDMEQIRKYFGIKSWTVYGLSYGTVVATMYGSLYPESTTAVVLEGVFAHIDDLHNDEFKIQKMNQILEKLSPLQKKALTEVLLSSDNKKTADYFYQLFARSFFMTNGPRWVLGVIKSVINEDGFIDTDLLRFYTQADEEVLQSEENFVSQQPGVVDADVHFILYCKDMGYRYKPKQDIQFNAEKGFYKVDRSSRVEGSLESKDCKDLGVSAQDEKIFRPRDYPIVKPVYYFQGAYDGATTLAGAIQHWRSVPQGAAYFMLLTRGGHNPNLEFLTEFVDPLVRQAQEDLFLKAVAAFSLSSDDLVPLNGVLPKKQKWILWTDPKLEDPTMIQWADGI